MLKTQKGSVGVPMTFSGYAHDYDKAIVAVQFSLDGGAHWTEHATPGVTSDRLVQWEFEFIPKRAGEYRLLVRSVNEQGAGESHARRSFIRRRRIGPSHEGLPSIRFGGSPFLCSEFCV